MKKEFKTYDEADTFAASLHAEQKHVIGIAVLGDDCGYIVQWIEQKTYIAYDGKEYPDEVWTTEQKEMFMIQDLSEDHCRNILRMILRQEREGLVAFENNLKELLSTGNIEILTHPGDVDDASFGAEDQTPHTLH